MKFKCTSKSNHVNKFKQKLRWKKKKTKMEYIIKKYLKDGATINLTCK